MLESQRRNGGLFSTACQALAAKIMISEASQVSKGPGPGLQSSWEGEVESSLLREQIYL